MAFKFTMLNDGKLVQCQISDAALDELAGTNRTERTDREQLFLSLRSSVEGIASDLFAQKPRLNGHVVRIYTNHIKR